MALPVSTSPTGSEPAGERGSLQARLRALVGRQVRLETPGGPLEGTLLSCTARSAWVVSGDVDHLVALAHLLGVRAR